MPQPQSNFTFLRAEWPDVHEAATRAEAAVHADPRTACFYARRALELAVHWLYKNDAALELPYQDHLSAPIHEPTFRRAAGEPVFAKAKIVKELGNAAVHHARAVPLLDAHAAVRELFHFSFWLARTYARGAKPADALRYNPALLPQSGTGVPPVSGQLTRHGAMPAALLYQPPFTDIALPAPKSFLPLRKSIGSSLPSKRSTTALPSD